MKQGIFCGQKAILNNQFSVKTIRKGLSFYFCFKLRIAKLDRTIYSQSRS